MTEYASLQGLSAGSTEWLLEANDISKGYPGVKALKGVDFKIAPGEVVAVVGENGAGKSTLMKILSGAIKPDTGTLFWNGEAIEFSCPLDAQAQGISTIYQELMIIPELSVVENVFLGNLQRRSGILDWKAMRREARGILDRLGMEASVDAKAGELSVAEQQLIEIAKSSRRKSRLLIMDEPTASLSREEVDRLFDLVRSLRNDGIAVILITHHLNEIFEICDRLIVLRDGDYIGAAATADIDEAKLVEMMLGHKVEIDESKHRGVVHQNEIVLEARNLSRPPDLQNVSLTLYRGEVLGIAGLMGAGRTELVRALFGADRIEEGDLSINGKLAVVANPRQALDLGLGLAPEDRKTQGLILSMPIGTNVTLPFLGSYSGAFGLNLRREAKEAEDLCRKLFVKHAGIERPVGTLSGGNQQKVVLAKLVGAGTDIFLLDEPTRGIDIGAKEAIFDLIWDLTAQGKSVIVISSVIEELIRVCDRIVCMHLGKVTQSYQRGAFDLNQIMLNAMGKSANANEHEAAR
jgi:ABC-type sugar transport system ATPase subunit